MSETRFFTVMGMHRSGTSAVAGLADLIGAELGDESEHLPAAEDNPSGFFELIAFKKANDAALQAMGGRWDRPPMLPSGWAKQDGLADVRATARRVIEDMAAPGGVVVLKDPRSSLTLPLWQEVGPLEGAVVCLRDPVEVVESLVRRNGIPTDGAAQLWVRYTASALALAPDALMVDYAELLAAPKIVAKRLASHLGLAVPSGETLEQVDTFIRGDLQHRSELGTPSTPRLDDAKWLHHQIRERSRQEATQICRLILGPEPSTTPEYDLVQSLRSQIETSHAHQEARQASVERLKNEVQHRQEVQAKVERLQTESQTLRSRQEERIGEVQARNERLMMDNEFLRARAARLRFDLNASGTKNAASEVGSLQTALQTSREQARRAERDLTRLQNARSVRMALELATRAQPAKQIAKRLKQAGPRKIMQRSLSIPKGLFGRTRSAPIKRDWRVDIDAEWAFEASARQPAGHVTIIVPVHDAPQAVERCLDAIVRNTTMDCHLLLIDDHSEQPETIQLLQEAAERPAVTLLRNETQLGYTHSVNRGLEWCDTDVILLNSDTEVGPLWAERLRWAAYSGERVGTATAISDDAGAFAVPKPGHRNEVPSWLDVDAAARAVAASAHWDLPVTPTAHGFCTYWCRDMLDDVGLLDADAFPRGYGEENDLSMRAGAQGWTHVVADGVFVRHVKGSSFGPERDSLIAAGRKIVNQRHPDYTAAVRAFMQGSPMKSLRERVANRWATADGVTGRPRVLFVLHKGRGGTPNTAVDLAAALTADWEPFILTCDGRTFRLQVIKDGTPVGIGEWALAAPIEFMDHDRVDVQRIIAQIVVGWAIDVVHVRHLVKNTLDVFGVVSALGIPTVVSFHDYYMSCPTVHLLDDNDRFCGGQCTKGDGACRIPMTWVAKDAPHLKHAGVYTWRTMVGPHLEAADALITTSETTREVYLRSYPRLPSDAIDVIEHGRDLEWTPIPVDLPAPTERIRVLVPGNLDVHKGAKYLRRMIAADTGDRLEIHLAGQVDSKDHDLGVVHGTYTRDGFTDLVRAVRPHVIGIFPIWAETYCHTLSESWMTGIPVVATDIGAVAERIRKHGGGVLVPVDDPGAALRSIFELVGDPDAHMAASGPTAGAVRSTNEMAADYGAVYQRVMSSRRTFSPDGNKPVDVGLIALGAGPHGPGTVHVRTLRPLGHPRVRATASMRRVEVDGLIRQESHPDVLVVQRTAVSERDWPRLESWLDETRVPLVYEIDDLLFNSSELPDGDDEWDQHVDVVRAMMRRADVVTVSTPLLVESASQLASRVELIPNALDERLWFAPLQGTLRIPMLERDPDNTLRLLYVGTKTHAADLAALRPVLDSLPSRLGRPVRLTVIGGEADATERQWYRSLAIPRTGYPSFVPWVRQVASQHHVAVAPLADTVFTAAKSDLKWLEYTAADLPGVFADVPPYATVDHGRTGMVAPMGDVKAWVKSIVELADPTRAREVLEAAQHEVRTSRTLATVAGRWVDVITDLARAKSQVPV